MQTLISDLLSYSRVGTQGKAFESIQCDAVLDRVLKSLKLAGHWRGHYPRLIACRIG